MIISRNCGHFSVVEYLEHASTPQFQGDLRWNRRKAYVIIIKQVQTLQNTRPTIEALHIHDIHRYIGRFI